MYVYMYTKHIHTYVYVTLYFVFKNINVHYRQFFLNVYITCLTEINCINRKDLYIVQVTFFIYVQLPFSTKIDI